MNLYIIVEGKRTEKKVYPKWLEFLIPKINRIDMACDATEKNYYLFSGNGFPALLHNHLRNSIDEVNEINKFKYLVLILDVDESTIEGRILEVNNFIEENNLSLNGETELIIIPQNRCIESWFLGNEKVFKSNPTSTTLVSYINFYNVKSNDPEKMGIFNGFSTHSLFHADYCKEFLNARSIRYTKNFPNGVVDEDYLKSLISRIEKSTDLNSFKGFIDFCEKVNSELTD